MTVQHSMKVFRDIRHPQPIEQRSYAEYFAAALADDDGRTPILSVNEWVSAGRPAGPFTNG